MKPPVVIFDYDQMWSRMYSEERARILGVISPDLEAIEHVGSTAIRGIGAKPIIDIMVGLRRLEEAHHCIPRLEGIGYRYVPEFEAVIPERRYFDKGPPQSDTYHLHIVQLGSDFWRRGLAFRDYLRAHPSVAREYGTLKRHLAAKFGSDREGYTDAKTEFIHSVLAKAGEVILASPRSNGEASRPRGDPRQQGAGARP